MGLARGTSTADRRADRQSGGQWVWILLFRFGAVKQLSSNCKSIVAQRCTHLVEEVEPLAAREKKQQPVI